VILRESLRNRIFDFGCSPVARRIGNRIPGFVEWAGLKEFQRIRDRAQGGADSATVDLMISIFTLSPRGHASANSAADDIRGNGTGKVPRSGFLTGVLRILTLR
jgi:hypothetical protein